MCVCVCVCQYSLIDSFGYSKTIIIGETSSDIFNKIPKNSTKFNKILQNSTQTISKMSRRIWKKNRRRSPEAAVTDVADGWRQRHLTSSNGKCRRRRVDTALFIAGERFFFGSRRDSSTVIQSIVCFRYRWLNFVNHTEDPTFVIGSIERTRRIDRFIDISFFFFFNCLGYFC